MLLFFWKLGTSKTNQSQVTTFAASLAGRVDSSELFLLPKIFFCTQSCEAFPSSCFQSPAALSGKLASIVVRYCVAGFQEKKKIQRIKMQCFLLGRPKNDVLHDTNFADSLKSLQRIAQVHRTCTDIPETCHQVGVYSFPQELHPLARCQCSETRWPTQNML